jgi:putative DNA primase/helicase
MDFLTFCRACGVNLNQLPPVGRWVRVSTEDKPRSRNGAVKWMGDVGFVQNWATMTEPAVWRDEGVSREAQKRIRSVANEADREARELASRAAQKAATLLSECELSTHPYLASKGFPDELVNVWNRDADNVMVIPMRRGKELVGCQLIKPDGEKKFLFGQRSGGAEFVMGNHGTHVLCEGYATALSARQALRNLKMTYTLHVTFSAGNMKRIAEALPPGLVIADNDKSKTGERVAQEIGWPYWISDVEGEDFNDAHQRRGLFPLAMELKDSIQRIRRRA